MNRRQTKQIAHLDLDCFFVSVERIHDPSLIGKPVAVGGSPTGRGVVASASYEARAFGVRSAMSAQQALRLCPSLIFVRSRHGNYGKVSDELYHRMCELAPIVERASIDEMYLDFTGCEGLYGNDLPGFMRTLKELVWQEFTLPCSIALASNKTVAKIAVGTVKPSGLCIVPFGMEKQFLAPLPIGVIPGVGKKTEEILHRKGYKTVADIQAKPKDILITLLGVHGEWLHRVANGEGNDTVESEHTRKSIGREETFERDIDEVEELEKQLFALVEDVCSTLRGHGWKTRTITLKLRYSDFTTITRSKTIAASDHDPMIFSTVKEIFHKSWKKQSSVRLLGVQLSNFDEGEQLQLDLIPSDARRDKMLGAIEKIRGKFGDDVIHLGKP